MDLNLDLDLDLRVSDGLGYIPVNSFDPVNTKSLEEGKKEALDGLNNAKKTTTRDYQQYVYFFWVSEIGGGTGNCSGRRGWSGSDSKSLQNWCGRRYISL